MTADDSSRHGDRITDPEAEVRYLGTLEGLAVSETDDAGPLLFLHGDERSCAVRVTDMAYADGLARAGVEIEALLESEERDA